MLGKFRSEILFMINVLELSFLKTQFVQPFRNLKFDYVSLKLWFRKIDKSCVVSLVFHSMPLPILRVVILIKANLVMHNSPSIVWPSCD